MQTHSILSKRSTRIRVMNVVEEAIVFATNAHQGQTRKMSPIPYILHPVEVSAIIATVTDNLEVIAAGALHDTIEDCGVDPLVIREKFGPRVYALVQSETEDKYPGHPAAETWMARKEESLMMLQNTQDIGVKMLWLGDKLSNMRSFYRAYKKIGNAFVNALHQKDKKMHAWYYRTIAEYLMELQDTAAYAEYVQLVEYVFGDCEK